MCIRDRLYGFRDLVTRRSCNRGDDRNVGAGQYIQQRRLADIGLSGQYDMNAFPQKRTLCRLGDDSA